MLKGVSPLLSPQLLVALFEMGHGDTIVLADAHFPGRRIADSGGAAFVRADGLPIPALLNAVLTHMGLDSYVDAPVTLMARVARDAQKPISIWDEYQTILLNRCALAKERVQFLERFAFYEKAKEASCVVQTGEMSGYASIVLQKG